MRSLVDFPQAGGASPLDALVTLNWLANDKPPDTEAVTAWLVEAFLADVRENHRRMSTPEPKSPCDCTNPDKTDHLHNWVILQDNVDQPGGMRFLSDLLAAREACWTWFGRKDIPWTRPHPVPPDSLVARTR